MVVPARRLQVEIFVMTGRAGPAASGLPARRLKVTSCDIFSDANDRKRAGLTSLDELAI